MGEETIPQDPPSQLPCAREHAFSVFHRISPQVHQVGIVGPPAAWVMARGAAREATRRRTILLAAVIAEMRSIVEGR